MDSANEAALQIGDTAVPAANRRYYVFVLAAVYALSVLDRGIFAILLPPIKAALHLTDTQLGLLTGVAFGICYATLGIPLARLADIWNRRNVIAISLALFSAATAFCGFAGSFLALMLARIGVGIGEAGTTPPSTSLIADLYPEKSRATAMAFFTIGGNIGGLIGFGAGGIIAQIFGWRYAFFAVGLPGILLAATIFATLGEPARTTSAVSAEKTDRIGHVLQFLWSQRAFRHVVAGTTLVIFFGNGLLAWLPSFFQRSHGMSLAEIGVVIGGLAGGLGSIGILVSGLAADWAGQRDIRWQAWIPAIAVGIAAPFYALILAVSSTHFAIAAWVVPATIDSAFVAPTLALVQSLALPRMRAVAVATLLLIANLIGLGLGPLLIGMLSDALAPYVGAESLRYALLAVTPLMPWAAIHFYIAAKHVPADISRASKLA